MRMALSGRGQPTPPLRGTPPKRGFFYPLLGGVARRAGVGPPPPRLVAREKPAYNEIPLSSLKILLNPMPIATETLPDTSSTRHDRNKLRPEDQPVHDWYRFVLLVPPDGVTAEDLTAYRQRLSD